MADTPKQITTIKDANGKEFSIDLAKISDINGDLGDKSATKLSDANGGMLAYVHDMEIVDSKGQVLDSAQLIKDMSSGKTNVTSIDVEMEATHSGKNLNYCIYYEDSMEKDAETFMNPYRKPVLKNHNDYSGEPLGRIKQAAFGPSQLTDERSAIHLSAHITDQDAIPKFIDGRYATVSIGGSMGTVTCNICGKTILKDGKFKWCGHWRGETYKDSVCYWGARDITYHEVSTVNNPADVFAQIMKITVHTDSDENNDNQGTDSNNNQKEESTMAGTNTNSKATDAATAKKSVCDIIDQLLNTGTGTTDAAASDNTQTTDAQTQTQEPPAAGAADSAAASDEPGTTEDSEKIKKDLEDAQAKIKELEGQLADANKKVETAEQEAKDAKTEAESLQDKCIALATSNKELVADSIMAKEDLKDDAAKDERRKELMAMSMKDLNKLAEEDTKDASRRTPGSVTNPTVAGKDPVKDDSNGNGTVAGAAADSNNNKPAKTVDDFAQDIVGKLLK